MLTGGPVTRSKVSAPSDAASFLRWRLGLRSPVEGDDSRYRFPSVHGIRYPPSGRLTTRSTL